MVLVDEFDNPVGHAEKQQAHVEGTLHRAFSVFVFNASGQLLLQQRAHSKYHSGGLWSNSCCSHPRPGEATADAAHRRIAEEMGFTCALNKAFHLIYKAELPNQLFEHEFDHVFIGQFDGEPTPNPAEVSDYRWLHAHQLAHEVEHHGEQYSYWFRYIVRHYLPQLLKASPIHAVQQAQQ